MSTHVPRAVPSPGPSPSPRPGAERSAPSPVMDMLAHGLPLTLLLDLALGVRSSEVYAAEPPDLAWLSCGAVVRAG